MRGTRNPRRQSLNISGPFGDTQRTRLRRLTELGCALEVRGMAGSIAVRIPEEIRIGLLRLMDNYYKRNPSEDRDEIREADRC